MMHAHSVSSAQIPRYNEPLAIMNYTLGSQEVCYSVHVLGTSVDSSPTNCGQK
jgi:hypothetical protein